jgi:transcriptional regulator with XRE-family HTH domain
MTTKYLKAVYNIDTLATGKRLREIRKKHHITIKDLSSKTGLSKAMISEAETGKNKPSPNLLLALIKLYDVNVNWLLTGEGDIYQKTEKSESKLANNEHYKSLIWHLENTPVVRYSVMGYFVEFMHKYKDRLNK